ncbi:MAG: T9SS type A sorting domain-containing protein [bacterium]|nr:T9SS type A sorting domain-containing protein [bacterium]
MKRKISIAVFVILLLYTNLYSQAQFKNALYLNGDGQYFEIPDTTYLKDTLGIEFWFKTDNNHPCNLLNKYRFHESLIKGQGYAALVNARFAIYGNPLDANYYASDLSILTAYYTETGQGRESSATGNIRTGVWHHISLQFTRARKYLLIDRGKVSNSASTLMIHDIPNQGIPLNIGGYSPEIQSTLNRSYYFNGYIDELRIWSKFRTVEEIKSTMNDTLGPEYYSNPKSGLVGYYRFDEFERFNLGEGERKGPNLRDLSYNQNHGHVRGGGKITNPYLTTNIVPDINNLPEEYCLHRNYPNPFNPETMIRFSLPENTNVNITVYNLLGSKVRELVNTFRPAGTHEIRWDGRNEQGQKAASGIYFYRIKTDRFSKVRKMTLIK